MALARARGRPHTLSHLVTARCNGRCPTCLWRDALLEDVDAATALWLYDQAGRTGIAQLVVWGGEPLLRQDIAKLLRAAGRAGLLVTLITNGWLLAERWPDLRGSVDVLIISLDDVGPAHDPLRGLPGLFERLDAFAGALTRDPLRPTLLVNTVLSIGNRGALSRVAPVAKRWGAGMYFCPMETGELESGGRAGPARTRAHGGSAAPLDQLALPPAELRAAAREATALKGDGYPLLVTPAWLELLERDPALGTYRCRGPHSVLTVTADGGVRDCRRQGPPAGRRPRLRARGRPLIDVLGLPRRPSCFAKRTGARPATTRM